MISEKKKTDIWNFNDLFWLNWLKKKDRDIWKVTFSRIEADAAVARAVQDQRRAAEAVERPRRVHAHSILAGSSKGALIIIWKQNNINEYIHRSEVSHFNLRLTFCRRAGKFDIHQCSQSSDSRRSTHRHGRQQSKSWAQNLFWRCTHSDWLFGFSQSECGRSNGSCS